MLSKNPDSISIMYIYFPDLTHQNKSLLWSFPEGSTSAQCTYKIAGGKDTIERHIINEIFKDIPGIEIKDGVATIVNVDDFRTRHPFNIVLPLEEKKFQKISSSRNLFYKQDSARSASSSSTQLQDTVATPPMSPRIKFTVPLTFKTLLADFPGETLVYDSEAENNLCKNTDENLRKLLTLGVHSVTSINLTMQVIKNVSYYFLRQQQIGELKKLFEKTLIPELYEFQKGEVIPKFVLDYFAHAVRNVMVNHKYNKQDTAFESNYIQDNDPIPIEENYAVRKIYAVKMLQSLRYLINNSLPPTENPDLANWLEQFKKHFHSRVDIERIRTILNSVEQLTICTGLMDHDYNQISVDLVFKDGHVDFTLLVDFLKGMQEAKTTLSYALTQLSAEHRMPPGLITTTPPITYPLKSIVFSWYQMALHQDTKAKLKDQGINELVTNTMELIIPLFMECTNRNAQSKSAKHISHTIKGDDTELYITQEWKELFESAFLTNARALAGSKKSGLKPEKWKAEVIKTIKNVLADRLNILTSEDGPDMPKASSSYTM